MNDAILTTDALLEPNPFKPRIRRAKTTSHVSIFLPRESVGFFVLPGARMQLCIHNENETDLLLEEIEEDQNGALPEELELMLESRSSFGRNHVLEEITHHLKEELIIDEKYYNEITTKSRHQQVKEEKEKTFDEKIRNSGRKFILDRAKQKQYRDFQKRREELKKFLLEKNKSKKSDKETEVEVKVEIEPKEDMTPTTLELMIGEAGKIIEQKKIPRTSQRNSVFTDEELDKLMSEARHKFTTSKVKRDINMQLLKLMMESGSEFETKIADKKSKIHTRKPREISSKKKHFKNKLESTKQKMIDKRNEILKSVQSRKETMRSKLKSLNSHTGGLRFRRDINMDLLKVKAEGSKKKLQKNETPKKPVIQWGQKEATLRKPGQTSDELLEELAFLEPQEEEMKRPDETEVFAQLADPDYPDSSEMFETTPKPKKSGLFDRKSKSAPFGTQHFSSDVTDGKRKGKQGKKKSQSHERLQFLTSSEEFTDIEDHFPSIHEFYGPGTVDKQWEKAIHELGEYSSDERKEKKETRKKKKKGSVSILLTVSTFINHKMCSLLETVHTAMID